MTGVVDPVGAAVGFARTLRSAGVPATTDRLQAFLAALDALDPCRRDDVYWAGRVTLCGGADDLARYDRAFTAFFDGDRPASPRPASASRPRVVPAEGPGDAGEGDEAEPADAAPAAASMAEVLRHKDFAALSPDERAQVSRWLAAFRLAAQPRRTRRWQQGRRGMVDRHLTVRHLLRHGGEPVRLHHRRHADRPRRVVLLLDVSGSMSLYADALLRFTHAAAQRGPVPTEVFTIGTRLTRVTQQMAHRDPDLAMAAVVAAVPDFSGGTRLGELLKAFLDRWGQRGMARGAIVVVLSDGWEQGDAALLGEQMARLSRLAHRIVWANPRKARPGYAPLVAGMAAALPFVDDFVAGNSVAALERLARVVAGRDRAEAVRAGT